MDAEKVTQTIIKYIEDTLSSSDISVSERINVYGDLIKKLTELREVTSDLISSVSRLRQALGDRALSVITSIYEQA